jgi:P4 family phage/plasmid primase-like protien
MRAGFLTSSGRWTAPRQDRTGKKKQRRGVATPPGVGRDGTGLPHLHPVWVPNMNDMQEAAAELRRRGFGIVWLRPGEKRPTAIGWTKKSQEPDDYRDGDNLGILTGRLSGDVVCVDLDGVDALRLADEYLPPTGMVEGRPGKPRAHRYYRVTDIPAELTARPDVAGGIGGPRIKRFTGAGIDFQGTGGQVAVPPSKHPSGEVREWEAFGEPATVPMAEMFAAVKKLAIACGWKGKSEKPSKPIVDVPKVQVELAEPIGTLSDQAEHALSYALTIRAISGQGGHDATFRVAKLLTNDFALTFEQALSVFSAWNTANAVPPWSESELHHKLKDAVEQAGTDPSRPIGCKIIKAADRPFNDPRRLALNFVGTWRYWNQELYRYTGTHYLRLADADVKASLRTYIHKVFDGAYAAMVRKYQEQMDAHEKETAALSAGARPAKPPKKPTLPPVNTALVNEVLAELQSLSHVPGTFNLPCLLPDGKEPHLLAFTNGLLNVQTGEFRPHSSDWFSTVCIGYEYKPDSVEDRLPAYLAQWFSHDPERIALAQEWAGYLLTRSTDAQSYMMLTGEGGNGKGAFMAVIEAMLSEANLSYLSWEDIGSRFAPAETVGKLANITDDVGELDKAAEGRIKWLVGGKSHLFERKGKTPFSAVPTCRLMMACNKPPRVWDRSDGVWRRMLVLPFDARIAEGDKIIGMDKPAWWEQNASMPGVLNWALAGLRRLQANGWRFTRPRRSEELKGALRLECNPAAAFLQERVVADRDGKDISSILLYTTYSEWCAQCGYQRLSSNPFSTEVKRKFPEADTKPRKVKGTVGKYWFGIRWYDHDRDAVVHIGRMTWPQMFDLMERFAQDMRTVRIYPLTEEITDAETGEPIGFGGGPEVTEQESELPSELPSVDTRCVS